MIRQVIPIYSIIFFALPIFLSCSSQEKSPQLPSQVSFNYHIKPILSDRCYKCHGPDANSREAELRLDTEEGAFKALLDNPEAFAIVKGNKTKSEAWHRINSNDPEEQMPPPASNLSLSAYEVELIGKWIDQGASWEKHWAFIPPSKQELPKISKKSWPANEIDHFVLAKLDQEGLKPANAESKEKWLRRVCFDLTGLPPDMELIEQFLADDSPEAYEKMVDLLLQTPAYGERMASIWLDAARYADSHGYQDDRPRTMWPWRDWVVKAFNENMPYDSFLVWQLAGDLLPNPTYEQKLATGFNRNHAITQEGGVVNEEYITEYVADRTNTFSTALLGLTMECARCHDHKYDPLSQKDYYQLFAFFNGLEERGQISYFDEAASPNMRVEDKELEEQLAWLNEQIDELESEISKIPNANDPRFLNWAKAELPNLKKEELLADGLISQHNFDQLEEDRSPATKGFPAQANVGLVSSLKVPALVEGKNGNALEFAGNNFMNLGQIGDFDWYNHFSYGAWIKVPRKIEKLSGIITKRNGEQKRGGYDLLINTDRTLQSSLIHNAGKEKIVIHSKGKVPVEKWTHIMVTYDGSGKAAGLNLYINGEQQKIKVEKDELDRKSILNGNDLIIGNWTHRNKIRDQIQGFESGSIDEMRIYERTLSPIEVALLAGKSQNKLATAGALPIYLHSKDQEFVQKSHLLDSIRSEIFEIPHVMIMQDVDSPRTTHVLSRGAYNAPAEQVFPTTPEAILSFPENLPPNRMGLAQWLTQPDHPLTARVMVNRCWQIMFGNGLVKTAEDFGSQGALPSHPDLLDWLAVDFIENGWDVKRVMKQIALSATYRQSAKIDQKKYQKDRENLLLARGPNKRFSSEMIRDNALSVSGLLNHEIGGKWVKPYQPDGVWRALANQIGENKYRASSGKRLYRRSLYSYWKRTIPPPMMLTFDAAERTVCVVKRQSTSTPLQALVLLNDPQFVEASRALAGRMLMEGGEDLKSQLAWGFRMVTSRNAESKELKELEKLVNKLHEALQEGTLEDELLALGELDSDYTDKDQLLVFTVVANTLLNLDEAKMKS